MKTLGTNAIRIYHVDPDADHSGCMAAFANAGIYTLIDLDTFNTYILPVCNLASFTVLADNKLTSRLE
jgi:1,3-beta-glucanosyltransferase GAS1